MASKNLAIATAVKDSINTAGAALNVNPLTPAAVVRFSPVLDLRALATRAVLVVPAGYSFERKQHGTRGRSARYYSVEVFVFHRIASTAGRPTEADVETNLELYEKIGAWLEGESRVTMSTAKRINIDTAQLPEAVQEQQLLDASLFAAGLTVTYLDNETI